MENDGALELASGKPQAAGGRLHAVDLVKGICILLILITHYNWNANRRLQLLFPFWVDMAVPVFMIISGYVHSGVYGRRQTASVGDCYSFPLISDKIVKYTLPFLIIFGREILLESVCAYREKLQISASGVLFSFLQGSAGPGSYYYPIMIQFLFWFPVIYSIIKKYDFNGLVLCGIINFVYELLKSAYGMNEDCYRLLLFRYTLSIAFGCYMAIGKTPLRFSLLLKCMACGVAYILLFRYLGLTPFITQFWTGTSLFASLYIVPIAFKALQSNLRCAPLEILGKASYDIFLVQMSYYHNDAKIIYGMIPNKFLQLFASVAICVTAGVAFHYAQQPITNFARKKVSAFSSKYGA